MSYDPRIGRWISEDPIGFAGGTTNLSEYVGNNPLNSTDPTGLKEALVVGVPFKPTPLNKADDPNRHQRDYGSLGIPLYYVYDSENPSDRMFIGHYYPERGFVENGFRDVPAVAGDPLAKNRVPIGALTNHINSWGTSDSEVEFREWFAANHMSKIETANINTNVRMNIEMGIRSPSFYDQLQATAATIELLANINLATYDLIAGFASPSGAYYRAAKAGRALSLVANSAGATKNLVNGHYDYRVIDPAKAAKVRQGLMEFYTKHAPNPRIDYVDGLPGKVNGNIDTFTGRIQIDQVFLTEKWAHLREGIELEELYHFKQLRDRGWFGRILTPSQHQLLEDEVVDLLLNSGLEAIR